MNIVLGATGQIGSMLVDNLLMKGQPVRAVIRNSLKAQELKNKGVEVIIAERQFYHPGLLKLLGYHLVGHRTNQEQAI
jgi:uncharacterized protein YbjT (DUF2867 family)